MGDGSQSYPRRTRFRFFKRGIVRHCQVGNPSDSSRPGRSRDFHLYLLQEREKIGQKMKIFPFKIILLLYLFVWFSPFRILCSAEKKNCVSFFFLFLIPAYKLFWHEDPTNLALGRWFIGFSLNLISGWEKCISCFEILFHSTVRKNFLFSFYRPLFFFLFLKNLFTTA